MAVVNQLYVELRANIAPYAAGLSAAAAQTRAFGGEVKAMGADMALLEQRGGATSKSLAKVGLVAGGALVAGLGYGVVKAIQLEESMQNVATISSTITAHMGEYTAAVVKMSTELPQSANTLAKGLYDIVSSGFDGADALTVLKASAGAASAGLTDTATAGRAIVAVLNAYGLKASQASDVSDILFETVNKGVISFEELAHVTGTYVGVAAAAGVSIQDADAALAAMTLTGLNAENSATYLRALFTSMLKPTDDLTAAFHQMGFESGAAALKALGLHGTVLALSKSQGTAADSARKLFGNVRAMGGYLALTSADGKNYASTFDAIANTVNRADAAHKALLVQQKSTAYQMKILKNDATAFAIGLGEAVLPVLHAVVGGLTEFVDFLNAIPGPIKDLIGLFALLGGGGLLAGAAFLKLAPAVRALRTSMVELEATGSVLPGVMKTSAVALGALGIALIAATVIYGHYQSAKEAAAKATDDLSSALQQEQDGVKGAVQTSLIKSLVDSGDGDRLDQLGISVDSYVGAVTGGAKAQAKFKDQVRSADPVYRANGEAIKQGLMKAPALVQHVEALGSAYDKAKHSTDQQTQAQKDLNASADKGKIAFGQLSSQTQRDKNNNDLLTDSQTAMNKAYAKFEDVAGAAKLALTALDTGAFATAVGASTTKAGVSISGLVKNLHDSAKVQQQWQDDLANVAARGGQEFADALQTMGSKGVALTHQLAVGSNAQLDQVKQSFASLAPATRQSLDAFTRELGKQLQDEQNWSNNLARLAIEGRTALVTEFQKLGPTAAPLLAQAVNATSAQLDALAGVVNHKMALTGQDFQNGLNILAAIAAAGGKATVASLAAQFTHGDLSAMRSQLNQVRDAVNDIPSRHAVDVILQVSGTAAGLRDQLAANIRAASAGLPPVHIRTVHDPLFNANGAVYHADGAHVAQIAPGLTRVWAEPETGGEAYIPLSPAKRGRSKAILGTVAGMFGGEVSYNADGGVVTAVRQPAVTAGRTVNFHTTFQVLGNVYGDADLQRRTQDLMDRRDKELTARVRGAR